MIRQLGPSRDQRFDKLPELICEWVEQYGERNAEAICTLFERLAAGLREYCLIAQYARENKPDSDDWIACKRAMRRTITNAFEKVERE